MTFSLSLGRCALLLLACSVVTGCWPSRQSQLDEEKEPHFLEGKRRVNAFDSKGAIESFERALEVNPHSASAHFELGVLYEQKTTNYAAAIFHFDKFLQLRPDSEFGEVIRQRTLACKQELARSVSLGPVTQTMQREYEQLAAENKRLHEELDKCRAASRLETVAAQPTPAAAPPRLAQTMNASSPAQPRSEVSARTSSSSTTGSGRTHTVKAGETPSAIAKRYGVKVAALMAANPGVDARRLHVGQPLTVPTL